VGRWRKNNHDAAANKRRIASTMGSVVSVDAAGVGTIVGGGPVGGTVGGTREISKEAFAEGYPSGSPQRWQATNW